jgi:hypothetical protein
VATVSAGSHFVSSQRSPGETESDCSLSQSTTHGRRRFFCRKIDYGTCYGSSCNSNSGVICRMSNGRIYMSYVKRLNHSIVVLTHPGGSTNTLRFGVRGWSGGYWLRAESVIVRIKCISYNR